MGCIQELFRLEHSNHSRDSTGEVKTLSEVISALDACTRGRVPDTDRTVALATCKAAENGKPEDDLVFGPPPKLVVEMSTPLVAFLAPMVIGRSTANRSREEYQPSVSLPWLF